MHLDWLRKVVLALTALGVVAGLAAAIATLVERHAFETSRNRVALVVDFASVEKLARLTGQPTHEWLEQLRSWGYEDLAVEEDTLESLEQQGFAQVVPGSQLMALRSLGLWRDSHPLHADRVYVISHLPGLVDRIEEGLRLRFLGGWQRFQVPSDNGWVQVLEIPASLGDGALKMGVGFGTETLTPELRKFRLYPRLNNLLSSPGLLEQKMASLRVLPPQGCLIMSGMEVLGYPHDIPQAARLLRGLPEGLCFAEMVPMDGLGELKHHYPHASRLHSITEEEMKRFSQAKFVDRYVRAARERNIRVLYVRAVTFAKKDDLAAVNQRYLTALPKALKDAGLRVGRPTHLQGFVRNTLWQRTALMALLWLAALLAVALLRPAWQPLAGAAALAGTAVAVGLFTSLSTQLLLALLAASVVPALPMVLLTLRPPLWKTQAPLPTAAAWAACGATSLAAGVLLAGAFASSAGMEGHLLFRGIKAALLLPVLLVLAAWAYDTGEQGSWRERFTTVLTHPPRRGELLMAGVLLTAALVMVVRSGNETGLVSGLELHLRTLLEDQFGVRPRTKEFLIGHPALMVGLYLAARQRRGVVAWTLLALGAVGQASHINTFCHFHSPIALSLQRAVLGLALGGVLGMAALLPVHLFVQRQARHRG